jgi:predicted RNA polymerase sigma factor
MDTRRAVGQAARDSYGRLVAFLAARSRDMASAEDALADAFGAALKTWPQTGIPQKPEAWLLTVARRQLIDGARRVHVAADAAPTLHAAAEEAQELAAGVVFPDERLKLMFICAHPAIDAAARTPLMLQTVLGLDAARIASAFLVRPTTMGQRLTRAKMKIRDARIAFELPEAKELPPRLDAVLEAIYAAYGSGWDDVAGSDPRRKGTGRRSNRPRPVAVAAHARRARGARSARADALYCEARRNARRSPVGAYVPLAEQNVALWSKPMIEEAERLLVAAEQAGRIGRFQLEAAIQTVHARRASTGETDWESIALLYEGLVRLAPTVGALVARAAAVAEAREAAAGWVLLETLPAEAVMTYQPYWALAAHLLQRMGRADEASNAYGRAIGLCEDAAMREFLSRRAAAEASRA